MKKFAPTFFSVFVAFTMALGLLGQVVQPAQAVSTSIVISQVYGGGGNSGATYKNDFIELYNLGPTAVNVTGWTVQYASSAGTTWNKTPLSGTIQPGKYYLIQEAAGSGGTVDLPTPDATGTLALSATAGKVALVSNSTTLTGACPTGLVDFLGFGSATTCSETTPTANLSNTTAAIRKNNGATDTDNNSADFSIGSPNPRNSAYPFGATGLATPSNISAGDLSLLTVTVTPGTSPTSTGIAVTCNLSAIGGPASQAFYDDGTHGDLVAGNNVFSYTTTSTVAGSQTVVCTFSDAQSRSGTVTITLTVITVLPIGTVNGPVLDTDIGTAHVSPYNGSTVTIKGVIYEKTLQAISNSSNTYKGFFLQNTAASKDADPNTSDGLFVFMSTSSTIGAYTPVVGDEIILTGKVSEYYNMTELVSPFTLQSVVRTGVNVDSEIPPVVVNPPVAAADANRYWERLQGMRVQVPSASIVLGGRNVFSPADAEIWLARSDSTVGQRVAPYTNRAFRDAHPLDDNYDAVSWDGNGYRILIGSLGIKNYWGDAQALISPVTTYDTLAQPATGGINYTYSKYRIEVDQPVVFNDGIDPSGNNPPSAIDRSIAYSVADYNLENVYDYRNNPFSGCDFAGDTGCAASGPFLAAVNPPYDYVPASDAIYQTRLGDIASQIINELHSPDILMVQEVENQDICVVSGGALVCGATDNADGKPDVLQELALKITALGGPSYDAAFDRDSSDLRGILPAYLYRTDRVELLPAAGDPVLGSAPAVAYAGAGVAANADVSNPKTLNAVLPGGVSACETSWVFPRAVSVGLFRIWQNSIGTGNYADVYMLNNHFKSGPDTCVGHRTEQAKYNAALIAFIESAAPGTRIIMGGDLNVYPRPDDIAYGASDQLGSLYDPSLGMTNLLDVEMTQSPEGAYSYVYLGMAQTLDQMFVNPSAFVDLQQFKVSHINSDFPADYTGDTARGTSDHDPSVAAFNFGTGPTAALASPLNGETLVEVKIKELVVAFNVDVMHDGGQYAADNTANYMLVEKGRNHLADTVSCASGVQADDKEIVINSAVYNPSTRMVTLGVNDGVFLPEGDYRLFVCGTTSIHDLFGHILNNHEYDSVSDFSIRWPLDSATTLPATGFAPDRVTELPAQTVAYDTLGDLWLEIPSLNVKTPIIGVPQTGSTWDVTWLGSQAGWLEGSAYPTALGNSVLTAHVWDALNKPGAFYALDKLGYGDKVIVHSFGTTYTYEVRRVMTVAPTNVEAMLKHQEDAWLTLVTCKGFVASTDQYAYRTLVRAVLVDVR